MHLVERGFILDPEVNKSNANDYDRSTESQQKYSLFTMPLLAFQ